MTPLAALNSLIVHDSLQREDMLSLMRQIMSGELTPAQIAGILIALRVKGETVTEIAAAAEVMREFSDRVHVAHHENLVDTCGTGGDGAHTFNISTTTALVAAAAGARVAKHGGRSVSSTTGSADVLEALGVHLALTPDQVGRCIDEIGVGFMFAPNHHRAMRYTAPIRKELGVRTLFNILGPLTNPAGAQNQILGVYDQELTGLMARVLQSLGSNHVMVVHGSDGLDEFTLTGSTQIAELKDGEIYEYHLDPDEFGLAYCDSDALRADTPAEAKDKLLSVLNNQHGPARDIVLLNAGAALYVSDVADSFALGIAMADDAIASGAAKLKLEALVEFTQQFAVLNQHGQS
jgi:anthranilate phosphoribosyltransferase